MNKKRKGNKENNSTSEEKLEIVCCSCMDANLPFTLLTGCSNNHTICHLCARQFVSAKLSMSSFPFNFPGTIKSREELECPLCKEPINGITNLFVSNHAMVTDGKSDYTCPYRSCLSPTQIQESKCEEKFTLTTLRKHLIYTHNNAVKCPHCLVWLNTSHTSVEELLHAHIAKKCQKVPCYGCDRKSSMLNLYMHSTLGDRKVCDTSKQLFQEFGLNLAECCVLFEDTEQLNDVIMLMLRWVLEYLTHRSNLKLNESQFNRVSIACMFEIYGILHARFEDAEEKDIIQKLMENVMKGEEAYNSILRAHVSSCLQYFDLRVNQSSKLPFFYRLISITFSGFANVKQMLEDYTNIDLTPFERECVCQLSKKYIELVPDHSITASVSIIPDFGFSIDQIRRMISL